MPTKKANTPTQTDRKTRRRDEYEPIFKTQLKHRIKGRNVFLAKFRANKHYSFDKIKSFVQDMQDKLRESDEVHTIQLGIELDSREHYCTKMSDINDEIGFSDPLNAYSAEDSNIIGFTLYLS